MNLLRSLVRTVRNDPSITVDDWLSWFTYGGNTYPFGMFGLQQTLTGDKESAAENFTGFVQLLYRSNGVVFAVMLARQLLFSEARFQFRRLQDGRPGELFGSQELQRLEAPWRNGTTGDLLARMIQDADLAGNFYATPRRGGIKRMRPDWVTIVYGTSLSPAETEDAVASGAGAADLDADVIGYIYQPGGDGAAQKPVPLSAPEVVHFAPIPDPIGFGRGMSWLTPVVREVMGDTAAVRHKLKFFENGATPNMVVSLDASISKDAYEAFVESMEQKSKGLLNAYKTLYLGGGATTTVVGSDLRQLDFKVTQGAGETRIAAAGGVPPVIVGLSEGLEAATYSNYAQARRRFADGTMRPLWRNAAASLAPLVSVPASSELWYDDRDIPFLREDEADAAEIQGNEAQTIRTLVDAGFKPESVIAAVKSRDFSRLEHTGLFSVQLQPPDPTGLNANDAGAGKALAKLIAPHLPGATKPKAGAKGTKGDN